MSGISKALLFLVSCVFTQNVVLVRMFAGSAFFRRERRVEAAAWLGLAAALAMTLTALCGWIVYNKALIPLGAGHLQILAYVLIAAGAAWLSGLLVGRINPAAGEAINGDGWLLAADCALLGTALLGAEASLGTAVLQGLFGGLGFLLAMVLFAGVRRRVEDANPPKCMEGLPITLIAAAITALSFTGFGGIVENIFGV